MKGKELSKNLHIYSCLYRQIADKRFEESGIYFGQPPILKYLSLHPNASQNEIADFLDVSAASIATSVKRMEKSGLIQRTTDKNDARRNLLKLTEKGMQAQKTAEEIIQMTDREIFETMSDEQIAVATDLIKLVNENAVKLAEKNKIKVRRRDENV